MDAKNAFEAIEAIRTTVPADELQVLDSELATRFGLLVEELAGSVVLTETVDTVTATSEHAPITAESLLDTFDSAYQSYGLLVDSSNDQRATVKGSKDKRPEQLTVVDQETVRAEIEALLANPGLLEELEAEADYFTKNPEVGSPEAGFDLVIVPEGLTPADEQATAKTLQAKITTDYTPYIRPEVYNDSRTPTITGKGFRVAIAPRHYNVPKGTTSQQTAWMKESNHQTTATELQTATDGEALAQINNLQEASELNDRDTRFSKTYFRRFDQAPHGGDVSDVRVVGDGWLFLGKSFVLYDNSTRALVVPKA
jgi:hypothetical protein